MDASWQPKGECPRCGFHYRLNEFRKEWTGLRVCGDCWDPKPAETRAPRIRPEGLVRRDALPELPNRFRINPLGIAFVTASGRQVVEDGQAVGIVVDPEAGPSDKVATFFAEADAAAEPIYDPEDNA